jgi:hypothetical protein
LGSTSPIGEKDGPQIPVKLKGGIIGYFVESDCGAHCDDSAIGWREGKYYYSISLKAENKEIMIRIANSAIDYGHKDIK